MKKYLIAVFLLLSAVDDLHAFSAEGVSIHGFVSQGFLQSTDNNYLADTEDGTFQFNEMGINLGSRVTPGLKIGAQLFARDLGPIGNDEIKLDWATGEYYWKDWLGIRAGKMKVPHGLYNETRDIDLLRTSVLLPNSVYLEENRDELSSTKGGGIFGRLSIGSAGGLSYQVHCGVPSIDDESGLARKLRGIFAQEGIFFEVDSANADTSFTASLQWETPLKGLLLASSTVNTTMTFNGNLPQDMMSPIPALAGDKVVIDFEKLILNTFSMEYRYLSMIVTAEYMRSFQDYSNTLTSSLAGPVRLDYKNDMEGYYGNVSYRFFDWFEMGSYYSEYFFNRDIREGDDLNYLKDWAVSTRFDINEHWIFKLEGHMMRGKAFLNILDHDAVNFPEDLEKNWFLFATKVTFVF